MAIASWLTPAAKSGTGNKTVGLTASKNTGASRTTIVTVSVSGITKTINCTQTEADKFTIKISALTTNSSGTTITNVGDCSIGASATGGVKEGTYYRDTSVTLTAKAAPTGYDFVGWYEGSNLVSTSLSFAVTLTANRTLVAKYKIKSYTVNATSENTNKGTVSPAGQTVEHGANATVVATSKAAYNFAGWYNGATKVSSNASYTFAVTVNISLTAKFTIKTFTTTTANSTGGTASVNKSSVEYGGSAIWTATPSTGYNFSKWSNGSTANPLTVSNITANTHITPVFVLKSYTVTWNPNGGSVSPTSTTKTHGSTLGTLPTPTRAADVQYTYTFKGWFTAATDGTQVSASTTVTKNVTYYAQWTATRRSYTIGYQTTYGSLNRTSQSVAYGSKGSCTLTMPSNNAQYTYTFQGWYTAANGGGTKVGSSLTLETPSVTDAATYYAYVTRAVNRYTFTFNANGGSTPSSSSITKNYNEAIGTLPTCLRAADNTYTYAFAGWFDTAAASGGTQLTTTTKVTSNKTWYARWATITRNYTVTWNGNGGTPSKSSSSFHYNDVLGTLPTATRTEHVFKGWSTSASGSVNVNESTKVTKDVTYYAIWQINRYELIVNPSVGGTVTGGGIYDYGTKVTLKATPSDGYHFVKWSDGDTNPTRTVTVTRSYTYVAVFAQDAYLKLDKTSLTFEAAGGTQTVKVTSNVNWTVS